VNRSNRSQILAIATAFLLVFVIAYHIWANWGLITIHAKQMPLSKVIASMQRQGHVKIMTDMPGTIPVTMDVDKVTVAFALEKLTVVTDANWRLLYFAAADSATLKKGEDAWLTGNHPQDWRMIAIGGGGGGGMFGGGGVTLGPDDDAPVFDPRNDIFKPKAAAPQQLQAYFGEAAQMTSAAFAFPDAWNPTVASMPAEGIVTKSIPKLVSKVNGKSDAVFFVSENQRAPGPGGFANRGDFNFDPDLLAQRVQNEINQLPPEEKTEAQNNFDEENAFRKSLQNMTDDQRMAAFQQRMQDPNVQANMMNRMDSRDSMMNHDQRTQRMQNYVNRKQQAMGRM
jgi:hypothetical protein